MFWIGFTKSRLNGKIIINNFEESIEITIGKWSKKDYVAQWEKELNRLINETDKTILITDYPDFLESNIIDGWIFYRESKNIFVQNRLILPDEFILPLTSEQLTKIAGERETVTEDGEPISEWKLSIDDLVEFISK